MQNLHKLSYCQFATALPPNNPHRIYHDQYYGRAAKSDNELFARLILEINQAGLSWDIILKKQQHFRRAYNNFEIHTVANYTTQDVARLLNDSNIIRHELKIHAAIYNAGQILHIQQQHGSFKQWLDEHTKYELAEWIKLFKKTFKFTGREITKEFLQSTAYIKGAHDIDCPFY